MPGLVEIMSCVLPNLVVFSLQGSGSSSPSQTPTPAPTPSPAPASGRQCAEARAVLERNWQPARNSTIPSYGLYPHQWSWDSGFIAIGYAGYNPARARAELTSLFRAQWSNGLLPHIVFNPDVPRGAYFPDGVWWQSETQSAGRCPVGISTSGIVDPPVHVGAALRVFESDPSNEAFDWVKGLYPRLCSWLNYLHRERSSAVKGGLVWVRHPWESGMDNAPLWDAALDTLEGVSGCPADTSAPRKWSPSCVIPPFGRQDLAHSDPAVRPSNSTYDKFLYLVILARNRSYDDMQFQDFPFKVIDVLFNSILVQANRDLAKIASYLGHKTESRRWLSRAASLQDSLEDLWSDDAQMFLNYDLAAGRQIHVRHVGGLAPLLLGPGQRLHREELLRSLVDPSFSPNGGLSAASSPSNSSTFDRRNYWRGPAWINVDWLLSQGLPKTSTAGVMLQNSIRKAVELPENHGFYEYFDIFSGAHQGTGNFSWTAALYHDLFCVETDGLQSAFRISYDSVPRTFNNERAG